MTAAGPSSQRTIPTTDNFATFHTEVQSAALKATRASAGFPVDLDFYKSVDEGFKDGVERLESRILALLGRCIALADGKGKGKEVRIEGDDLVDDFHGTIVDSVDTLLEKTDICLDEFSGKLKRPAAPIATATSSKQPTTKQATSQSKPYLPASLQHASSLSKPQLVFPTKVDNSDDVPPPHIRFLKHKYNARVPLGYVLQKDDMVEGFAVSEDDDAILPSHPYYFEITHLKHSPHVFSIPSSPTEPSPLPSPVTYITTSDQFSTLLEHLSSPDVLELAVDLEHHSYRTYRGFLCLMQLTTRSGGDFILDLLAPEVRTRMHELNEVFTDPSKIKVFHGAESDIVWLQQDFGLYVVGLFDTFHASKLLDLPRHSLQTLLELYADYTPDKKYQLADWRIRPIPEEMMLYAQSDTHWLLYLYDRLRGALVDKEASSRPGSPNAAAGGRTLLEETLFRSSQTSLRQYTTEVYDAQRGSGPGGWDTLARKWNKGALVYVPGDDAAGSPAVWKVQRSVYRAVHAWRDRVSREEDESTRYVLPNHFLFTLAEAPPADMNALLGMFRGGQGVPPVVKKRAGELLGVVKEAVKEGLEQGAGAAKVVEEEVKVQPREEQPMVVDQAKVIEPQASALWGNASSTAVATKSSALLGPSTDIVTSKSTLFGSPSLKPKDNPNFKAIVSKINSTLVIAPTVPKLPADADGPEFDPVLGMHVDAKPMAYVPASQRTTKDPAVAGGVTASTIAAKKPVESTTPGMMEDMGPIVVVGRKGSGSSNRKKRKREAAAASASASAEPEEAEESKGKGASTSSPEPPAKDEPIGNEEDDTPYDFTAESNVLDAGPAKKKAKGNIVGAAGKKGKKAGKDAPKGTGYFYSGEFGAAPKQRSDFKGGNKSHTFK